MDTRALVYATTIGTIAQIAMVVTGHFTPAIANLFAVGGMSISLLAGLLYTVRATRPTLGTASLGGLLAGGVCALLGIAISFALGDVTAVILGFGTLSSAVTGALGGAIGWLIVRGRLEQA